MNRLTRSRYFRFGVSVLGAVSTALIALFADTATSLNFAVAGTILCLAMAASSYPRE